MKWIFVKALVVFTILTVVTGSLVTVFNVNLGNNNFFNHHGYILLFSLTIFPRLTLLFSSIATGGFIWWISLIFAPRFLIATLATLSYFKQNPGLVVLSWLLAIGGESFEKGMIFKSPFNFKIIRFKNFSQNREAPPKHHKIDDENVIEAEYTVKKDDF